MYLVAADTGLGLAEQGHVRPSAQWDHFPVSYLSHHGQHCCDLAIEWLRAMDFAQLNGAGRLSGPRWLRERFQWGPSSWPLHWCEAVERKILDCGAHAALAHETFAARGVTSFRVQLVQLYNREAVEQWRAIWSAEEASSHWLGEDFIYHEANAVLTDDGSLKLWDGSASSWIKALQNGGYGSLLSVRIFADTQCAPKIFRWGSHALAANEWNELVSRPAETA